MQAAAESSDTAALKPYELMQRLTLKDAQPLVYWCMDGSCGYA